MMFLAGFILAIITMAVMWVIVDIVQTRRLRRTPAAMSGDWCEVCQTDLPVGKVYELRNVTEHPSLGGKSATVATYCKGHAPAGSVSADAPR